MKTLYFDCGMGAAGDMLTAALLELHPEPDAFLQRLNALGIPGVTFATEKTAPCGITGTRMVVRVNGQEEESLDHHEEHHHGEQEHMHSHEDHGHVHHHEEHTHSHGEHGYSHEHYDLHSISHIVAELDIPQKVREDVMAVYQLIAQAESHVHGRPVTEIHFHEVGSMDAVADVTAVCLLMYELAPDHVVASPIHVGSGKVQCAHGILPVPAPATAYLLQGIPTYGGQIQGELCTPTGAALLKHFVNEYGCQPPMAVEGIGYGCGKKEFPIANCVRALLGETAGETGQVLELQCNLDDMTPEAIGYAMEELFAAGALDVYTIPIGMKKNRPGVLLTCMCKVAQREQMIRTLFRHTTTLGIRETICNRYTLDRTTDTIQTEYGPVRIKRSSGWGVQREKIEYDDLARIAKEQGISLSEVAGRIRKE